MKRRVCVLMAGTIGSLTAGCMEPRMCTEIGCVDGIFVTIEASTGERIESFGGEVSVDAETVTVACTSMGGGDDRYVCVGNTLQLNFDGGEELRVDLTATDDPSLTFQGSLPLEFEEAQPNGEGCPPVCRQAHASITLAR